jgi:hypothetical protein
VIAPVLARRLQPRLTEGTVTAVCRVALVLLVIPANLYLYAWRFVDLRRQSAPYYLQQDEAAALDWLAKNATPDDVVLAPEMIGQFVPNYGETRAYLAHWAMTNRYCERVARVRAFFAPELSDDWRASLLRREGVTMVLRAGSLPGAPALFDPATSTRWEPLFSKPHAQIFRLRGDGQPPRPGDSRPPGERSP